MDAIQKTTEFIRDIRWDDLPEGARRRARLCLLDGLGVTLAGTLTGISQIAADYAAASWRGDTSTIFLHRKKASAAGAAFANACAGNALDLDDDAIYTRGHPGAQLIPAAFAVAEKEGADGRTLLEALAVGYEVAIRAGRCWHDHHQVYQSCGSWGSLACAAAAAHLMRLGCDEIKNALGIAEYHAPNAPMMRDIKNPSMAKHAIGWGAMNGVTSAELASLGYTGIPCILGMDKYREWVMDIGEKYWMTDWVYYKEWASCAWGHAACVAALGLKKKHGFSVNDISHIRVRTFEEATMLHQGLPATTEEAQFSVKWPLACLLIDGKLGPEQILERRLKDPGICALVEKIEVVLDPAVDRMYKEAKETDLVMHSAVEITLKDGRHFDSGIVERGADRYDEDFLVQKFRELVAHVLPPATVEQLVEMLSDFENLPDVRRLTEKIK